MSDPGDRGSDPHGPVDADGTPTQHMPATEPAATTQMPAQPSSPAAGAAAAGAAAAAASYGDVGVPPGDPYAGAMFDEPAEPWYRKPGPLTAAIIGGLLFLALLFFLLFQLFSTDDDDDSTVNRLRILATDETGAPVDRGFIADVTGPPENPDDFLWLQPSNGRAPEPAGDSTGSDGRVEFRWAPTQDVPNPSGWMSEIVLVEEIPPDWTPPGPIVECVLERRDVPNSVVEVQVEVDPVDPTQVRTASYRFIDHRFQPGDTVDCTFTSVRPGGTTTTSSTTSSTSSTSTSSTTSTTSTVPETTVVETTEPPPTEPPPTEPPPTEPPPTEPPPTEPPPTEPTTTVAPVPETLLSAISERPEFSTFVGLANVAGLADELNGPDPLTVFVPTNQAFDAITIPGTADEIRDLLLTHMVRGSVLVEGDLTDGASIEVEFGGPHVVDASSDPATIGGAPIVETDQPAPPGDPDAASNGVFHVIVQVLTP